jgi:hypothetical protein
MSDDRVVDHFRLVLVMHHTSRDPASITEALGLTPVAKLEAGLEIGTVIQKSTFWMTHYRSGDSNEEFAQALDDFLAFLDTHSKYLRSFISEGGEIQLSINQNVAWDDGIIMELKLEPYFIQELGTYPVGLTVQAWSAEEQSSLKDN